MLIQGKEYPMETVNPFSVRQIRAWLSEFGIRPSKGLGQNFLTDRRVAERIIAAAQLEPSDTVLEIGAGLGALTFELAVRVRRVIAVEVDARLVAILEPLIEQRGLKNITLIQANALSLPVPELLRGEPHAKVVANIPYSITSPLLEHLLAAKSYLTLLVLTDSERGRRAVNRQAGHRSLQRALCIRAVSHRSRVSGACARQCVLSASRRWTRRSCA
jgi:16S rRNA (adenine1518-N6/adenine1519-N6)-dimethyltransferase